jgi:N-acetylneuraminic acid mutarotase
VGQLPKPVSAYALAKHGSQLYLVGAYDDIDFLGRFDAATQQFTALTSNLKGRRHAGAAAVKNQLYVFGGNQNSTAAGELASVQQAQLPVAAASAKAKK